MKINWKPEYKNIQNEKGNVIVISRLIHNQFHKLYGFKSDEQDWYTFVKEQQYAI